MSAIKGKIIQSGYDWSMRIVFKGDAINFPTTATFLAHVRRDPEIDEILSELSTANGTIERVDAKTLDITIPGEDSADWPNRKVYIDIARTDEAPPEHLGFRLIVPVQRPITRL